MQDKRGFIWIGTDDGLNRFDGNNFTIYRNNPVNPNSVSGNIITALFEDEEGVLWIATADGGLTKYNYRLALNEQFVQYKHSPGNNQSIPGNIINAIKADAKGNLWLATSGYDLLRFNIQSEKFTRIFNKPFTFLSLCFDKDSILWAGRQGGSINKINITTGKYEEDSLYNSPYAKLPHVVVTCLLMDKEKNMWYGSWDKTLYRYNNSLQKEENLLHTTGFTEDAIISLAEDNKGNIWIGGRDKGLQLYNKSQNRFYNYQYDAAKDGTIASNHINAIYIDKTGVVWLGTNKGLSVYKPWEQQFVQQFLPAKDKTAIRIFDFYKDGSNRLWLATSAGIFIRNTDGTFLQKQFSYNGEPLSVSKFYKAANGDFYIGTSYSLFKYNIATHQISLLPNTEKDIVMKKIIESRVVSVVEHTVNNKPVLMVSPYGHYLAYYDWEKQLWVSRQDTVNKIVKTFNLKDFLIRHLYKTSDGKLWMATAKEGLGEWTSAGVMYYKNNPAETSSISNNNVYDIKEDKKNNLWLGTYGGGLNYFNRQQKKFTHISGSPNLLEGIETDKEDNVWMISNGNLHKFEPAANSLSSYSLPDLEKSGGITGNIFKDAEGNLYVSGANYFIEFNPAAIKQTNTEPKVFFTDFKIFNQPNPQLLNEKTIRLNYRQNYFAVEFAAPEYAVPGNIQYAYMLEGSDKDWINAGAKNSVTYNNLPAGDYVFKVRATNKRGLWGNAVSEIKIKITPPFWKTIWFYVLLALLISLAVYFVYNYRINELLKRQEIRNKIAQDLHDSVGSALSSISVYSQVAKIYGERKREEELQDTLEKISSTSGEMISEMGDIVWAINPRNDSMEKILQRMESFALPLLKAKNITCSFDYDESLTWLNLPMEMRKNFYLIFKESVTNIIKYADCTTMQVSLKQQDRKISLTVKDDGKGFDVEAMKTLAAKSLSGNGLVNMKRRAAEMKGELTIQSSPGKGTTVKLIFPIP